MYLLFTFLSLGAVITSSYCVRIPLFATLRHLQHEIDNLKAEVVVLRGQTQEQCRPTEAPPSPKIKDAAVTVNYASCLLTKSGNGEIVGRVDLREQSDTNVLQVHLQVDGAKLSLEADSKHGFHVHTYGNISASCSTTGGHYNPDGVSHASPTSTLRHVGDFGNVQADDSGDINVSFNDTKASLTGDKAIMGRGFVLHAGEDDIGLGGNAGSLASGNAGSRLACCVIGWATGTEWVN